MNAEKSPKMEVILANTLLLLLASICLTVIYGWLTYNGKATTLTLGTTSMKFNTALCFSILCLGLVAIQVKLISLQIICGAVCAAIALITLMQSFLGMDFHIDQLLAYDLWSQEYPGRMGSATAACFLLSGTLLMTHHFLPHTHIYLYDNLIFAFLIVPLFTTFAYIFAPREVSITPLLQDMPFHSCISFLLFFFSLSWLTYSKGGAGLLTRQSRHASNFRMLFLLVLVLPLTLGSILQFATQVGWIGAGIGIAIFSLFATLIISVALAHHTIVLDHWLKKLLNEQQKIHLLQQQIHELIEISADAVLLFDEKLNILHANSGAQRILGYTPEELKSMYLAQLLPRENQSKSHKDLVEYIHNDKSPPSFSLPNHIVLNHKSGKSTPVSVTLTKKILSGQPLLIAIIKNMSRLDDQIKLLEKKVFTDPLTHTLNRAAFENFGERITVQELRKSDVTFCVLLLDIDNFKSINDQYGHEGGDRVLIHFTKVVKSALRNGDRLFRTGGEEFVVISSNLDEKDASLFAERIRQAVEKSPIFYEDSPIHLTCSIGVCVIDSYLRDLAHAVKRADGAMYQAKHSGKNRVVLAPSSDKPSPFTQSSKVSSIKLDGSK